MVASVGAVRLPVGAVERSDGAQMARRVERSPADHAWVRLPAAIDAKYIIPALRLCSAPVGIERDLLSPSGMGEYPRLLGDAFRGFAVR